MQSEDIYPLTYDIFHVLGSRICGFLNGNGRGELINASVVAFLSTLIPLLASGLASEGFGSQVKCHSEYQIVLSLTLNLGPRDKEKKR